jgi:hypothetical protein
MRAAQHRRDLVDHLREGEDLRRLIHHDDAACRMQAREIDMDQVR